MATILLVDDDPDVGETARFLLARQGHDVRSAANGRDALAILRQDLAIDLIVTDVVMPEMDGVALAREARELRPELPVVFVSGYVPGLTLPDGGGSVFLKKPYRTDALVAAIDELLGPTLPKPRGQRRNKHRLIG